MTVWGKHKPVRRQTGVAPPQAIALWLLVTIVRLCSQALTSGDKGQRGKRACERAMTQIHTNTQAHLQTSEKQTNAGAHTTETE